MHYKYKAFISYRHLEPDMQAAEKLHKLLEAYKVPKNLGKTKGNWRIFRDVSELQSSSDLVSAVKKAVEALPAAGDDKPVIPEAEYALSRELGVFAHENVLPALALKHECAVEKLSFMGGGKSVVSRSRYQLFL